MITPNDRLVRRLAVLTAAVALMGCNVDDDTSSAPDDESVAAANAALVNANVPYLRQRDYTGIGESACAPTALAMILRFYYPNSNIDVREIYHAGLQLYGYDGPALGYRNLSW